MSPFEATARPAGAWAVAVRAGPLSPVFDAAPLPSIVVSLPVESVKARIYTGQVTVGARA
jgi:hypothetical protein